MKTKSLIVSSLLLAFAVVFGGCAKGEPVPDMEQTLADMLSPEEIAEEFGEKADALAESEPNREARLVIMIDKAKEGTSDSAQTMDVYLDGKLYAHWPVSTGRERWEKSASGRRYFSKTPVGKFRIYKRVKDYFSNTWQAPMPFAQFIVGGIAIHATTESHYDQLRTRASGGCIRLRHENAEELWHLVREVTVKDTLVQIYNSSIATPNPPTAE